MESPLEKRDQAVNQALDGYLVSDEVKLPPVPPVTPPAPQKETSISQTVNHFIQHRVHETKMGMELSHIVYKERGFNLKNRGIMYGLYSEYTYRPTKDDLFSNDIINMYRIDGKLSFGSMEYSSDGSGTDGNIHDYLLELRAVLGYDHYFDPTTRITPYLGLGYRRLSDDSATKVSSTGAAGYGRISNYIYMPIGLELTHQLDQAWQITGIGEFDLLLGGNQESKLTDVDPVNYPDFNNKQERGIGLRSSLELLKKGNKFNFLITPFVRYWHIAESKPDIAVSDSGIVYRGVEPDNNTTEVGVKLGAQF
jgi:hypothetical protein